ncbi:MAG: prepilin peptidase [Chloroflexota bacterium]
MVLSLSFLLGIALGSFLNVVIDRVPLSQSLFRPRSRCQACSTQLAARDLIPILSYLWLRGHCRTCSAPIPLRILLVELAAGTALTASVAAYGITTTAAFISLSSLALLTLAIIDIEHGIVPGAIVLPLTILALAVAPFYPPLGLKSALIGAAIPFALFLAIAFLHSGGIGWGDVKLAPLLGLLTGFPGIIVALLTSFILGGVAASVLLLLHKASRKTPIPFVPFLAAGTIVAIVWGDTILDWYLSPF